MKKLLVFSLILVVGLYGAQAFAQEDALEVLEENPGYEEGLNKAVEESGNEEYKNREEGLNTAIEAVGSDPSEGDLPDVAEDGIGGPGPPPSSFGPGSFGPGSFGPGSGGPGSVGGGAAGGRR